MVGPGTGIAPFRAFLEERAATGATGNNWLFFGDQRRATDYLYQEALEAWHQGAHLHRLDLAFSRDQEHKVYVQHRMLEAAAELWSWLQEGAHFYVCGDASRMAKDVDAALHQVCETAGGLSADAAKEYVSKLKSEKRYQRDVY
jgi:sulfite reductase (NADPH) flavoprotein alpha-component